MPNKQQYMKVALSSFHFNGHSLGIISSTKSENHPLIQSNTFQHNRKALFNSFHLSWSHLRISASYTLAQTQQSHNMNQFGYLRLELNFTRSTVICVRVQSFANFVIRFWNRYAMEAFRQMSH